VRPGCSANGGELRRAIGDIERPSSLPDFYLQLGFLAIAGSKIRRLRTGERGEVAGNKLRSDGGTFVSNFAQAGQFQEWKKPDDLKTGWSAARITDVQRHRARELAPRPGTTFRKGSGRFEEDVHEKVPQRPEKKPGPGITRTCLRLRNGISFRAHYPRLRPPISRALKTWYPQMSPQSTGTRAPTFRRTHKTTLSKVSAPSRGRGGCWETASCFR